MDCNMNIHTTLLMLNINYCISLATYEIFQGFDIDESDLTTINIPNATEYSIGRNYTKKNLHELSRNIEKIPKPHTTLPTYECPEDHPSNIGPYEVPSQKDLVLLIKKTLVNLFNSYHEKTLFFLKDIKMATKATVEIGKQCPSPQRATYKKCVKHVSNQCEMITKSIVTSLERQRQDINAFTKGTICDMAAMNADPMQLIKILAMEEVSLEFALPGFLRLLSACFRFCSMSYNQSHTKKPDRHLTDQDLVIKYFLNNKNYSSIIKV